MIQATRTKKELEICLCNSFFKSFAVERSKWSGNWRTCTVRGGLLKNEKYYTVMTPKEVI